MGQFSCFLFFILSGIALFCPVLISALTGNWWFMLLFIVTWIPGLALLIVAKALAD